MVERYYKRIIEKSLKRISDTYPVLLLTGPRQVGKTTTLQRLAKDEAVDRKYVSLDNPTLRALAKSDPELFLQRYAPPVLIDEVQYAPELFDFIKIHVDTHKKSGDFWLTGSQTFKMMKGVTESLAGRVGIARLLGLSNSEINRALHSEFTVDTDELLRRSTKLGKMTVTEVYQRIFMGSMPRLYEIDGIEFSEYFESYLETYISRDIKDLTQVADELSFLKFVNVVAARTASSVNYDELAREVGVSAPTAKQWLSLLVSSGLVTLVQPFSNNALTRVVKAPRMYFLDTGLCAHLTRWTSAETLERGAMDGAFFETWVVSEIYKSYLFNGLQPPLFYYRDNNKREIDLIIARDGIISPIEIKKSSAPKNATKNFSALKVELGTGAVICMTPEPIPIDRNNWLVPAWLI